MKRISLATLALFLLAPACERQVKPAAAPAPKPAGVALAAKETVDQTPELEAHPRALEQSNRSTVAIVEIQQQRLKLESLYLRDPDRAPMPVAKDGFIATANHTCPIMQKMKLNASTAVEHTVQFEGKVIGFCCADCVDAWASMGDDERRAMLTTVLNKK